MKKRTLIRGLTAALSLVTAFSVFAGCRVNTEGNKSERRERTPRSSYEQDYDYDFNSRETLTIKILAPINEKKFSRKDNLIPQIEAATNTKLDIEFVSEEAFADRLVTSLGKNDTPELFCRVPNRQALIKDGAAFPLYDLLMQYAPNYMDTVESYNDPNMLLELTDVATFEIYSMMNIREPECQLSFLIRKDWLDALHLDVPNTWDEFLNVLRKFKTGDPNGNGKADEIPFSVQDITNMRYAFGIDTRYYFAMDGDEYVPTVYHSQYKNYLESLQELYAEGLLDNRYFERGYNGLQNIMANNTLGCTVYFSEYAKLSTEDLRKNGVSNGTWVGIQPIKGPDGESGVQSAGGFENNFMISSKVSKDKAREIVRFMNWFYTKDGINLMNYGIDGVHNTVNGDGTRTIKAEYANFTAARKAGMLFESFNYRFSKDAYLQYVFNGNSVDSLKETDKLFYDALGLGDKNGVGRYNFVKNCFCLYTDEWTKKSTTLEKAMNQFEEKAIAGVYYGESLTKELENLKTKYKTTYDEAKSAYKELKK